MSNGNDEQEQPVEPVKEPEVLPLPEVSPAAPPPQVSPFEEPYFYVLQTEKQNYKNAFENSRRNLRAERIRKIQTLRESKVVVYYSLFTLAFEDAELLFDLLQSVGKQQKLDLFLLSPGGFIDP